MYCRSVWCEVFAADVWITRACEIKGYFIVCKCSVRVCFNDSRVEICGCVYKKRVGIKREEFNKPFSHHPYPLLQKGFFK